MDDILDVGCLVLATMTPELQKQHEYMVAYEMIQNLKEILKGKHNNRDRVREYLSLDELLKECGIVSQLTPHDMSWWNGVYERRNRTLLDMVRSMMSHNDLPTSFWGHALETAAFTLNHVSSKSVQKTPHEMWTKRRPS
ncbi:hypothetical protein V6N12_074857 [Hibiscus sabdariffa]|uniref:Integrase catalytic domain-containing protein n=1 Tax=Hibiscus sabdariffa TaxID=183260 RepID=A0ABR2D2L1_9ROSI